MNEFFQVFSFAFTWYAIIIGLLISVCAAALGVILVLKKYTLIGHGLADVSFLAYAAAFALGLTLSDASLVSFPVIIAASFVIMFVSQKKGVSGDVAISVAATASLALGIVIVSVSKGFNQDISNLMFGSIYAVTAADLVLTIVLSAVVLVLFFIFYNKLFSITVDEPFAKARGINVGFYQFVISFLTAIVIVVGIKIIGSLLISSLIVFPALTAKAVSKSFKGTVVVAAASAAICFLAGFVLSIIINFPVGATVVCVNALTMTAAVTLKRFVLKRG